MSAAPWSPPRPSYHLRVFAVSLGLVTVCLSLLLFGVSLEAVTPATGVILAREEVEVRAHAAGLVEPGWYEDAVPSPGGAPLAVRLDYQGDGITDPAAGPSQAVHLGSPGKNFHALRPGDELWPGQVVAVVRPEDGRLRLAQAEERLRQLEERGDSAALVAPVRAQRDALREQIAQTVLRVPEVGERWLALAVRVSPWQAVRAGDLLAQLVPLDPQTGQPRDLVARLDVAEQHGGFIAPGEPVRLFSPMYNHRLHGWAAGVVERLEPYGEADDQGRRHYHVWATVTPASFPFPLKLGSSCRAEIVVGRKPVYRIILEH